MNRACKVLVLLAVLCGPLMSCEADDGADPEQCSVLPARFDQDTTLPKGCYLAEVTPTIAAAVRLTLAPGVRIEFSKDTALEVGEDQVLVAEGTEADPILLTGAKSQRGYWQGLRYESTASAANRLAYVTVEYAGSKQAANDPDSAGIKVISDSRPALLGMTHCTIRHNEGWGLWLTASTEMTAFASNTLEQNGLGPINLDSDVVRFLDAGSSYVGNDTDRVHVRATAISIDATWPSLDVPYFIDGSLEVAKGWTLAPGVTLTLGEDVNVSIEGDAAALHAVGTELAPIRITGAQTTPGYWGSIIFDTTRNGANALDYVTVEYGGGDTGEQYNRAAIVAVADSYGVVLSVTHCAVEHSAMHGIWLATSAEVNADIESSNTFSENALGDVIREQ